MFSICYALFTKSHYNRATGIVIALLDVLLEAFLFIAGIIK